MKNGWTGILCAAVMFCGWNAQAERTISPADYGVLPNGADASPGMKKLLGELKNRTDSEPVTIRFPKGRYDFFPKDAAERTLYISNHDQTNPKKVAFPCEDLVNVTLDGAGSDFMFHGRMIPITLYRTENCTIRNFSIDFVDPQIVQLKVLEANKDDDSITTEVLGGYTIENGRFIRVGEGWRSAPMNAIAFDGKTRHLYPQMSDIGYTPSKVEEMKPGVVKFHNWLGKRVDVGARLALRSWERPSPGIVLSYSKNTLLKNVNVHYSDGMGLLAQLSENITLDAFNVCLRGTNDSRYFTAQADATHFSGCKGLILSKNGLYEGMMDDAINIHGTYLKMIKRVNDTTLRGRYMHGQAWGFEWGRAGDAVQFVESAKMETAGINRVKSIRPADQSQIEGAREYEIVFENPVPPEIEEGRSFGIENLEWTPEVIFRNNIVRNNRARGALFSTPRKVLVENNFFDHTNGTAILLCGDCNGWFETGACTSVTIRKNRFLNALTSNYQFTNAVISVYPEIPNLKEQKKFFHSGIVIEDNLFETFDKPILYAKSVDGLVFKNNVIKKNTDFKPFHWNQSIFFFERVQNIVIEKNTFPKGTDLSKELKVNLSAEDAVTLR